jgi:peptidoglycan hydrolase-like protein with peptidoglycan-binding domain
MFLVAFLSGVFFNPFQAQAEELLIEEPPVVESCLESEVFDEETLACVALPPVVIEESPETPCSEGEIFVEETEVCVADTVGEEEVMEIYTPYLEEEYDEEYETQCVLVSDTLTNYAGGSAVLVSDISVFWTALISGAQWIWSEDPAENQDITTTKVFTRTFSLDALPSDASIEIAVDDGYVVSLNGNLVGGDDGESYVNFTNEGKDAYAISLGYFVLGENTLEIEGTNIAWAPEQENPGGVLYKLTLNGVEDDCGDVKNENKGTLVIKKLTQYEENGSFDFNIFNNEEEEIDANVVVNNGVGEVSLQLSSGTYSIIESEQEDWEFTSVTCSYEGESAGSSIPFGHQISIYGGETVTCTFINNYDEDGGGGGNDDSNDSEGGSVLGAATSEEQTCGPLLSTYMRMGIDNNVDEVIKLQDFLNGEIGSELPLTGFFGPETDTAVRAFQLKYWEDVLQPWFGLEGSSVQDQDDSTGYVYKTTKWKINNIFCPESEAFPALP